MDADYLLMLLKTMVNDEVIATTEVKEKELILHFPDGSTRSICVD